MKRVMLSLLLSMLSAGLVVAMDEGAGGAPAKELKTSRPPETNSRRMYHLERLNKEPYDSTNDANAKRDNEILAELIRHHVEDHLQVELGEFFEFVEELQMINTQRPIRWKASAAEISFSRSTGHRMTQGQHLDAYLIYLARKNKGIGGTINRINSICLKLLGYELTVLEQENPDYIRAIEYVLTEGNLPKGLNAPEAQHSDASAVEKKPSSRSKETDEKCTASLASMMQDASHPREALQKLAEAIRHHVEDYDLVDDGGFKEFLDEVSYVFVVTKAIEWGNEFGIRVDSKRYTARYSLHRYLVYLARKNRSGAIATWRLESICRHTLGCELAELEKNSVHFNAEIDTLLADNEAVTEPDVTGNNKNHAQSKVDNNSNGSSESSPDALLIDNDALTGPGLTGDDKNQAQSQADNNSNGSSESSPDALLVDNDALTRPDLTGDDKNQAQSKVDNNNNGSSESTSWWSGVLTKRNVAIAGVIAVAIGALLWNRHTEQKKEEAKKRA